MSATPFESINIGDKASITKSFSQEEVNSYSEFSMDSNPVHHDLKYTSKTRFKNPIVQGLLVSSLFGGLLGSKIPGTGTIHLGQTVRFHNPVFVGERVFAEVVVKEKREDKSIIIFMCKALKENGELAISGEDVVMYKGPYFT